MARPLQPPFVNCYGQYVVSEPWVYWHETKHYEVHIHQPFQFSVQISKEIEVADGSATYTLGEEVFTCKGDVTLTARHQVYIKALNSTTYKFTTIPSVLNVSGNGQYRNLLLSDLEADMCHHLLVILADHNKVTYCA